MRKSYDGLQGSLWCNPSPMLLQCCAYASLTTGMHRLLSGCSSTTLPSQGLYASCSTYQNVPCCVPSLLTQSSSLLNILSHWYCPWSSYFKRLVLLSIIIFSAFIVVNSYNVHMTHGIISPLSYCFYVFHIVCRLHEDMACSGHAGVDCIVEWSLDQGLSFLVSSLPLTAQSISYSVLSCLSSEIMFS